MHLYELLRRPVITEKNTFLQDQNKYAFEVAKHANKQQIKKAVEEAFNVKVVSVNMVTMPSKTRRVGRRQVKTPTWKKAVVTVAEGQRLDVFEGA